METKQIKTTKQNRSQKIAQQKRQIENRLHRQSIPFDYERLIERFKDDVIHNRANANAYLDSLKPEPNSFERYLRTEGKQGYARYLANLITDDDILHVDMGLRFYADLNIEYRRTCELYGVPPVSWKRQLKHLIHFYSNKPNNPIPDLAFRRFDPYWTEWQANEA